MALKILRKLFERQNAKRRRQNKLVASTTDICKTIYCQKETYFRILDLTVGYECPKKFYEIELLIDNHIS